LERDGFGLSIDDCAKDAGEIERNFTRLADNDTVYDEWRKLVVKHHVSGVKVHDARLAASMLVLRVTHILTFNVADFARFDGITAIYLRTLEGSPLIS
jgi:predicted nucleic acid-binding protein